MIKITLFFTADNSLGTWEATGLLQREIRIYKELSLKNDLQVQMITYGDESDYEYTKYLPGVKIIPVYERLKRPKSRILNLIQSLIIPWIYRRDISESHILKTNQMWGAWVPLIAKYLFRKPLLVRCGYEFYDFSRKMGCSRLYIILAYLLSYLVYAKSDKIHVATNSDKLLVINEFKQQPGKINVRPNWIDQDLFKPLTSNKSNRILYVGRLNEQKNILLLIRALASTGYILDLVGEGEMQQDLIETAKSLDVTINFLGCYPNDLMPQVYNAHTIYVICSDYEGNPKSLLEAMSCGMPVIGTDVPGIREVINNNENGLLVESEESELRNALIRLMQDDSLREKLGYKAREYIKVNNSLSAAVENEYETYTALSNTKKDA